MSAVPGYSSLHHTDNYSNHILFCLIDRGIHLLHEFASIILQNGEQLKDSPRVWSRALSGAWSKICCERRLHLFIEYWLD